MIPPRGRGDVPHDTLLLDGRAARPVMTLRIRLTGHGPPVVRALDGRLSEEGTTGAGGKAA